MILSVLPIAGSASRRIRLRRRCAHVGRSAVPRRLRQAQALPTSAPRLAMHLTRDLLANPCTTAYLRLSRLAA